MAEFQGVSLKPKGEVDQEGKSTVNTSHDDGSKSSHGNNDRATAGNEGNVQSNADQEGQKTGGAIVGTEENNTGKDGNVVKGNRTGSQELSQRKSENEQQTSNTLRKEQVHGNPDETIESDQNRQSSSSGEDSQELSQRKSENGRRISDPLRKEQVSSNPSQTTESGENRQSSSSGKDSQMLHGTSRRQENDAPPVVNEASAQRSYSDVARQGRLLVQQAQQQLTKQVDFYLLILGDLSVDEAYINLGPENVTPLSCVMGIQNVWRCTIPFQFNPIQTTFKYKYTIHSKGHDFKIPLFGRIGFFSTDPSYCEERSDRRLKSEVQLDVFHYPNDRSYQFQTVPQSVIFYVQWLFSSVIPSTISEFLTQIERLDFKSLSTQHVKHMIDWIVKQATNSSVTNVQCFYLCIILGHIDENYMYYLPFPISDRQTNVACDRLLQSFNTCATSHLFTQSNVRVLRKVALLLVQKCSSPGWLTLAAYFYPHLGIKFILGKEFAGGLNHRYTVEDYQKTVNTLVQNINEIKSRDDQIAHQKMLLLAMKSAPVFVTALDLSKSPDIPKFFANEDEMVKFFVKFCQESQLNTSKYKDTGKQLIEFFQIPIIFRCKMYKSLYPILLDYAKSNDELKDAHVKIFLKSIISEDMLPLEHVLGLFMELSKSISVPRQNLLLEILNNESFEQDWQETGQARKVEICRSWVLTRVNNTRANRLSGLEKTKAVYKAIDAIMRCSLNRVNETLVQDVSTHVVEKVLRTEDALSILQAFAGIEKCTTVVQECYKSHVRKILTPKVVKKSSTFLEGYSTSSLGRDLLSCILDIVDVPKIPKESEIDDDD